MGASGLPIGPDRAGHQAAPGGGLPREPRALAVDLADLGLEPVGTELEAVGPEGVRLDDVGARVQVLLVDAAHEGGVREVQLVEAAVQEDAARVEHRAHGPVAHDDALGEALEKGLHGGRRGFGGHLTAV